MFRTYSTKLIFSLSLASSLCLSSHAAEIRFTPPGEVLAKACSEVNSNTPGTQAMMDRSYCLKFIEAALMMDRFQIRRQMETGTIQHIPRSFFYPYAKDWGINMLDAAGVAKGLVAHLRSLPAVQLDRIDFSDDTQMRLLIQFLSKKHPCETN